MQAHRAQQRHRHPILQPQQLTSTAVYFGRAHHLAGLDLNKARGQSHLRRKLLIRADYDQLRAQDLADTNHSGDIDILTMHLQVLLGQDAVQVAALDQPQPA